MPNNVDSVTVDVQLFGRTLLKFLKSKLVAVGLVDRSYEGAAAAPGDEIEVPWVTVAGDAAIRAINGPATASDVASHKIRVRMQHIYKAVQFDNLQKLFSSVDLWTEAARQLAYKIAKKADSIVCGLHSEIPYYAGATDSTTIFPGTGDPLIYVNTARKILMQNEADMDGLNLILNPTEAFNYRSKDQLRKVNESGDSSLLRDGNLGRVLGVNVWESQQIQNETLSVAAETASPGAVVGAHSLGATSLSVNSVGAGSVQAGTSFTIAGITNGTGQLVRFVVTADATITGNAATLVIHPPLPSALSGSEAVTFTEVTSPPSSMNLLFSPGAILAVARPVAPFVGNSGINSETVTDEQTGLSIRIAIQSKLLDATAGYQEAIAADMVFGAKVKRPEFAVKLTGAV